MSARARGYWPLSHHCGGVWPHDTAIAVRGLMADGFAEPDVRLAEGLLGAAEAFDYRPPGLSAGFSTRESSTPVPCPAACRPQAWSAAAGFQVASALAWRG